VFGLRLELASRDESSANRASLDLVDGERDELERRRIDRGLARIAPLDHQPRLADAQPDRSRPRVAHDVEPERALVEGDQAIDVVGAEGEMVDSHEGPELSESSGASFVDAHCHLDEPVFSTDREAVIASARARGVRGFVIGGYTPETFGAARSLRSSSVRVGVGVHPWAVEEHDDVTLDRWFAELPGLLAGADALGEVGLDRLRARRFGRDLDRQSNRMRAALAIGREVGRPIVLHVVHAHPEAQVLVRHAGALPALVVHGFVGPTELARGWLALGAHLSFGPVALRSDRTLEAARCVPLDRLLIESDSPHGSALPEHQGPGVVVAIAAAIAERRRDLLPTIAEATRTNAERIFFAG